MSEILTLAKAILNLTDSQIFEMRQDFDFMKSSSDILGVTPCNFNINQEMAAILLNEMSDKIATIIWDEQFIKDFKPDGLDELVIYVLEKNIEDILSIRDYFSNLLGENNVINKEKV